MNKSKAKGTRAETRVVRYLAALGLHAERRALSGSQDNGDIKVIASDTEMTVEVKAGKQTENPSRSQIEEWLRQTRTEAANASCSGALVVVRYRRSLDDAEVYIPEGDDVTFCYLDEFASKLAE